MKMLEILQCGIIKLNIEMVVYTGGVMHGPHGFSGEKIPELNIIFL